MSDANIAMLVGGVVGIVLGVLMITKQRIAAWSLSYGRGKMWVKILGHDRAMKAVRFVFGPIVLVFGTIMAIGAVAAGSVH
ncbi:MAG: hypothetical protein WAM90_15845 [Rhodanobacter sp.]